jgi:diguanylate cyclase (GGDEF)-like protein
MPNPSDSNLPRMPPTDEFIRLLIETLETLERPAKAQFLQRFFKSIAHVDLTETQSVEIWEQALLRKHDLAEKGGTQVSLQSALIDVLAASNLLRMPILIEYDELKKLQINAASDPLTGLYNRRFFDEYFEKELNRSARYSHHLALVVFDLHRFKEVNDRYGHQQGDVLLQMAAATLQKSMRTSDYAFRIGGDEFALLLPQSDTEQATALSRRLRATYNSTIEPLRIGAPLALDFGLAVFPEDGEEKDVLIRVADERLYQFKNVARGVGIAPPPASAAPVAGGIPDVTGRKTPDSPIPEVGREGLKTNAAAPPRTDRRRWDRVSLSGTHAYALIGEGVDRTARVVDLGYGGVALETSNPEHFEQEFHAVLHVPILPPIRVTLRPIYRLAPVAGHARVGSAFVT